MSIQANSSAWGIVFRFAVALPQMGNGLTRKPWVLLDLQVKGKIVTSVAPQAHFFNKSATLSVGAAAADGAAVSSFFGGSAFSLVSEFLGGSTRGFFGAGPTSFTRI